MAVLSRIHKPIVSGLGVAALCITALFGQSQQREPVADAIPIVVSPYGFSSSTMSLPAGPYLFVFWNRTGFDEIMVYLERMPGNSVTGTAVAQEFADSVGRSKLRLLKPAKLTAGIYRLRVADRPTWVCVIQVH
jgi:hypothetical protein